MNAKKIAIILIVLALAILMLGTTLWFDGNWNRQEITGDESPSWQRPSEDPSPEPEASLLPEDTDSEPENENTEEPGKIAAPDFSVYNIHSELVHLSDFIGKPVILNFWASWCGPCKGEMPAFQEKFEQYGEDIHFLMINLTDGERETAQGAYDYVMDQGYTFPIYFDTTSKAASIYGIQSIPTTFFIDAEGYAVAQATGAIDAATLQKGIGMILPEAAEETANTEE